MFCLQLTHVVDPVRIIFWVSYQHYAYLVNASCTVSTHTCLGMFVLSVFFYSFKCSKKAKTFRMNFLSCKLKLLSMGLWFRKMVNSFNSTSWNKLSCLLGTISIFFKSPDSIFFHIKCCLKRLFGGQVVNFHLLEFWFYGKKRNLEIFGFNGALTNNLMKKSTVAGRGTVSQLYRFTCT